MECKRACKCDLCIGVFTSYFKVNRVYKGTWNMTYAYWCHLINPHMSTESPIPLPNLCDVHLRDPRLGSVPDWKLGQDIMIFFLLPSYDFFLLSSSFFSWFPQKNKEVWVCWHRLVFYKMVSNFFHHQNITSELHFLKVKFKGISNAMHVNYRGAGKSDIIINWKGWFFIVRLIIKLCIRL